MLSNEQRRRLEQEKISFEQSYELQSKKITILRNAFVIETDPSRKFQYEQQIKNEETELRRLNDRLDEIENKLQSAQSIPVISEPKSIQRAIDYTQLRNLLATQNWKQADEETLAVMLEASGRQTEGWLDKTSIDNIPDTDLRIINELWVESSNGHFGFSVQRKIYLEVGGKPGQYDSEAWDKFCHHVGWRVDGTSRDYSGVIFDTNAPVGHLPAKCCRKMPPSKRHSWSNSVVYQIVARLSVT